MEGKSSKEGDNLVIPTADMPPKMKLSAAPEDGFLDHEFSEFSNFNGSGYSEGFTEAILDSDGSMQYVSNPGSQTALASSSVDALVRQLDNMYLDSQNGAYNDDVYVDEDSGQEVQRISVVANLPDLLTDHHADCMRRIVPKIREVLHVAQAEMQAVACKAFLQILQGQMVPLQNYTQTFLQSIIVAIDSKDPDVSNAWLETLLDVIDLLPRDVIRKDILSIAISKGQLSQSLQSRLACCSILGRIATKFEPFVIKKDILPLVQSLCQDVEYEVRGCMCRQLDAVSRGLGLESTKSAILPELVELTNDEESYVRMAGLETVVRLIAFLDKDTKVNTIIPLVCKLCKQALTNEDPTLPEVAKQLGMLCHTLQDNLSQDQKIWFLDYYKELCKYGASKPSTPNSDQDGLMRPGSPPMNIFALNALIEQQDSRVQCRKNAAYNMPAMVLFTGAKSFNSELYSTFSNLCNDNSASVRQSVAAGFHEVAKLLGTKSTLLADDLISLLSDDSIEVLGGIISHLPETLTALIGTGTNHKDKKITALNGILSALVKCEGCVAHSHDWRLQQEFLELLPILQSFFTNEEVNKKFVPLLFHKLHSARAMPVRRAAVRTLLIILRKLKKWDQRSEVANMLIDELCEARSCSQRALFIIVCEETLDIFSRAFFKQYFFKPALELTSDPVPNIRLQICPLIPKLKETLKLPADRQLLQMLEGATRKMMLNETDRDVSEAVSKAIAKMDRIDLAPDSSPNLRKRISEADKEDKKKEDEELELMEQEDEERRREEELANQNRDRRGSHQKKDSVTHMRKGSKIPTSTSIGSASKDRFSGRGDRNSASSSTRETKTSATTRVKATGRKSTGTKSPVSGQRANTLRKGSANSASSVSSIPSPTKKQDVRRASISTTSEIPKPRRSTLTNGDPFPRKKSLPR